MSVDLLEYVLTSSKSSEQWTAGLWDYKSETGNNLQIYKNGGIALLNSLYVLGNDYLMTAEQNQPLIHVWPLNGPEQIKNLRFILPAPAMVLAVSPDNRYLAVGIATKLYVWQISSGTLLTVQEKHLLPISCIKFSYNSDYLITASENGTVLTYNFGTLVSLHNSNYSQSEIGQIEPLYHITHHIKAVTDVHIGRFGAKARFVTVSLDSTCRLYNLLDGECLLNIIFNNPLTTVILDSSCLNLFLGTISGLIQNFKLHAPPRTLTHHVDDENAKLNFIGHKGRINCLSLNTTNEILVSGSDDFFVIVWNVSTRQTLNKIEHKGVITNAQFILQNDNMFTRNFKPKIILQNLQRTIDLNFDNYILSIVQDKDINFEEKIVDISTNVRDKPNDIEERLTRTNIVNKQLFDVLVKLCAKRNSHIRTNNKN